ncbi:hypothetical protein NL676_000465 [Syzygium grande]|nr:hypothetical protein NL676_000465 [Syzygium grande]
MSGGGELAATRCSMCMVGTPVEPGASCKPTRHHLDHRRGSPSELSLQLLECHPKWLSLWLWHWGNEDPSVWQKWVYRGPFSSPTTKICDVLDRCGKRFEDAMRKAAALADNVWPHCEFSLHFV